jgi:hypothetical protein
MELRRNSSEFYRSFRKAWRVNWEHGGVIKKGEEKSTKPECCRCGRARAQIDSGAIDAAGPKETAKALEMEETEMSRSSIEHAAANGCSIENCGEKKIVGNT